MTGKLQIRHYHGTFSRSFSLLPGVDADQVSAKFDNGLLTIRIPQGALPQPRRIQIDAGREEVSSGRERSDRSQARARNGSERKEERGAGRRRLRRGARELARGVGRRGPAAADAGRRGDQFLGRQQTP